MMKCLGSRAGFLYVRATAALLAAQWLCSCATPPDLRPSAEIVNEHLTTQTALHAGNPNILVLPGLVADRKAGIVTVLGRTTELEKGGIAEFILIAPDSAHGYEALAKSFAKASDIHRALEFIGIPAGRPYNPDLMHFWAKGERAVVSFSSPSPRIKPVRAEMLILNRRTKLPMPPSGFVFSGSVPVVDPASPAVTNYAADMQDPHSIISTYNDTTTVLDVPFAVSQSAVYGSLVSAPANPFPSNTLINITFERERRKLSRTLDMTLSVLPKKDTYGISLTQLSYQLASKAKTNSTDDINPVLGTFAGLAEAGCTPFVTLDIHPDIRLAAMRQLTSLLMDIQTDQGIRIEPPLPGQPYVRAFAPNPRFRDRAKRPEQPLELRITQESGRVKGELYRIEEEWPENAKAPTLKATAKTIDNTAALKAALDADDSGIPAIVIFAPESMSMGDLSGFIAPAYVTHPLLHIFLTSN